MKLVKSQLNDARAAAYPDSSEPSQTRPRKSSCKKPKGGATRELTLGGRTEEDEAVVQVLAVPLEADLGVVGELEVEVVAAGLEGAEVEGVGRLDGQVVEQDEDLAALGALEGEGGGEERRKEEEEEGGQRREGRRSRHRRRRS